MCTPEKIRQIAKGFVTGANRCMEMRQNSDGTIESALIAGVVLKAFSVELLLKSKLFDEQGNPVTKGHGLKDFYDKLSDDSKRQMQCFLGMEKSVAEKQIAKVSNSFVKWRYIYESEEVDLDINFLDKLLSAVQKLHE